MTNERKTYSSIFLAAALSIPLVTGSAAADENDAGQFFNVSGENGGLTTQIVDLENDFRNGTSLQTIQTPYRASILPESFGNASVSAGPLTVGSPFMLLGGLATLGTLIWLLMRMSPPRPVQQPFPSFRLVSQLQTGKVKPKEAPLWRRLLLFSAAAMVATGLAKTFYDDSGLPPGDEPVLFMVDNGSASAKNWDSRLDALRSGVLAADEQGRDVMFMMSAPNGEDEDVSIMGPMSASEALLRIDSMRAVPWPVDHEAALEAIIAGGLGNTDIVWLSNGLDTPATSELAQYLQTHQGDVRVRVDDPDNSPYIIRDAQIGEGRVEVTVQRPHNQGTSPMAMMFLTENNRVIMNHQFVFPNDQSEMTIELAIDDDTMGTLSQIRLEGENHAGATFLTDERWRHRPVGIATDQGLGSGNVFASETYFIEQALAPNYEIFTGSLSALMRDNHAVMVITDDTPVLESHVERLDAWVRNGGMLIRFAGDSLAQNPDGLLPVDLIRDRSMADGVQIWEEPQRVTVTEMGERFLSGIHFTDNIQILRQVMARPSASFDLEDRTILALEDGTPVVTAEQRGEGWIVLVHTNSLDPSWSNLALTGEFVDMLNRFVEASEGIVGAVRSNGRLPPRATLSEFGELGAPSPLAGNLSAWQASRGDVSPDTPPGFYGNDRVRRAHNLVSAIEGEYQRLSEEDFGTLDVDVYTDQQGEDNLKGILLAAGMMLVLADMGAVALGQTGIARRRSNRNRKEEKTPSPNLN